MGHGPDACWLHARDKEAERQDLKKPGAVFPIPQRSGVRATPSFPMGKTNNFSCLSRLQAKFNTPVGELWACRSLLMLL